MVAPLAASAFVIATPYLTSHAASRPFPDLLELHSESKGLCRPPQIRHKEKAKQGKTKPRQQRCDTVSPMTSFLGPVPGIDAQYDIEVSWPAGQFLGGVNLTISCNATDDAGRPLAAVQPLPFAVVANPQLK